MARRISKAETQLFAIILIVGAPIFLVVKTVEVIGWPLLIGGIVAILSLWWIINGIQVSGRRKQLLEKYGNEELVEKLMNSMFWVGQSSTQLLDSLGNPEDIDQKILKTKKKEVWKYNHQGGNRYGLRITLDNDEVVGWDKKD